MNVPGIVKGKFNVAVVLIGPHNDQGWSQSHYEGAEKMAKSLPGVNVAYVENVTEDNAERVFRSLSKKGFNLIYGTSFELMEPMLTVAGEYPAITFIHVSGNKSNRTNFGNVFGSIESMKYLAGMLAGARAKMDNNPRLGYIATFPIPEEFRLGNAFALGMRKTCPECTLDVRWIKTWHNAIAEKTAARSLFDNGAQVVFTGADTPAPAEVAAEYGRWGITYDWDGSCTSPRCLTAPYWDWSAVYARITQGVMDKTYKPGWEYFDADAGGLGLYGFMPGETLTPGAAELPAQVLTDVRNLLGKMQRGEFTRFDVFTGPIKDNQGNLVVPEGEKMTQFDLEQFPADGLGCTYCMHWWAEGVVAPLP